MPTSKKKTTRYRKLVTRPNKWIQGGKVRELTAKDLQKAVDNGNRLLEKGVKIPAPFAHVDRNGVGIAPVNITDEGAFIDRLTNEPIGWNSSLNAGFVDKFMYGKVKDEKDQIHEGLIAEFEIEGEPTDQGTPASMVGRTIQETSAGLRPDYVDMDGEKFDGYTPLHIALALNPVERDQLNFSDPITIDEQDESGKVVHRKTEEMTPESGHIALAMNETILMATPMPAAKLPTKAPVTDQPAATTEEINSPMTEVIPLLHTIGIDIPEDTEEESFLHVLTLMLRQRISDMHSKENETDSVTQPPQGGQPASAPVTMNQTSPTSTDAFEGKDNKNVAADLMLSQLVNSHKNALRERCEELIGTQRCGSEWIKDNVLPKIDDIQMSTATLSPDDLDTIGKGDMPKSEVELLIEGLESSLPGKQDLRQDSTGSAVPKDGGVPEGPRYNRDHAANLEDEPEVDLQEEIDAWASI